MDNGLGLGITAVSVWFGHLYPLWVMTEALEGRWSSEEDRMRVKTLKFWQRQISVWADNKVISYPIVFIGPLRPHQALLSVLGWIWYSYTWLMREPARGNRSPQLSQVRNLAWLAMCWICLVKVSLSKTPNLLCALVGSDQLGWAETEFPESRSILLLCRETLFIKWIQFDESWAGEST